ncbi:uncharacterized protein [Venturia canescens]|uniref:uncharacterized protein isoform X2 n=1 Tax=Venturia canescens TaxID=32260 RepID=UPI001C9CEBF5|nr:uncharacterized protein LOC122406228 isoform X2 [Venturia canescens]
MMKNFKLLVAGFLVILSVTRATRADIRKECRKQTGVSWAALKKLKSGDFNQADHKLKCYLRCFMMKNGIIRSDDQVDVENAIRHLPPNLQESSRKALFKCKNSYTPKRLVRLNREKVKIRGKMREQRWSERAKMREHIGKAGVLSRGILRSRRRRRRRRHRRTLTVRVQSTKEKPSHRLEYICMLYEVMNGEEEYHKDLI